MIAFLFAIITACGGGSNEANQEETTQEDAGTQGMIEYDLGPHGMPLTIMIPGESEGVATVAENELGGVDIMVGNNFAISVGYGTGDIALLKSDLQNDLVYESKIQVDEPNLLVYEKNIPGAEIDAEHHFFYTTTINGEVYDVQNIAGEPFKKAAIERMVASAKTLKGKSAS